MKFLEVRLCRYIWSFMNTQHVNQLFIASHMNILVSYPTLPLRLIHPCLFCSLGGCARMKSNRMQQSSTLFFSTRTHTHARTQGSAVIFLLRSFGGASTSHSSTHIRVELTCVATTQPAAFAHHCVCLWAVKRKQRTAECEVDADIFVLSLFYVCMFMPQLISYLTFMLFTLFTSAQSLQHIMLWYSTETLRKQRLDVN